MLKPIFHIYMEYLDIYIDISIQFWRVLFTVWLANWTCFAINYTSFLYYSTRLKWDKLVSTTFLETKIDFIFLNIKIIQVHYKNIDNMEKQKEGKKH